MFLLDDVVVKNEIEGVMCLHRFLKVFADGVDDDEILDGATSEAEDLLKEDDFGDWRLCCCGLHDDIEQRWMLMI